MATQPMNAIRRELFRVGKANGLSKQQCEQHCKDGRWPENMVYTPTKTTARNRKFYDEILANSNMERV
jgi:hypothetical protein